MQLTGLKHKILDKRNIIVIGASAGGFDAIARLVAGLPADLDAAIFIVWHMAPELTGILPQVLNRQNTIVASNAIDNEPLLFNRIYVAPPDKHMIIEHGRIRVTRGPKENRFRPAVDPLFRSAAYIYGPRVIGVVLSGALDDGTAGLWIVKNRGGIAIVQEPSDAEVSSMPQHALEAVEVDYQVPIAKMATLLLELCAERVETHEIPDMNENNKIRTEVFIASEDSAPDRGVVLLGTPSRFACPECHGVLSTIKDGNRVRYRCHTGHAYSADSLLTSITGNIEDTIWSAIRGVEESIILLNGLGDQYAEKNLPKGAARYFQKAKEAEERAKLLRLAVFHHEQLSDDIIHPDLSEQAID